jgi:hypothetical protein
MTSAMTTTARTSHAIRSGSVMLAGASDSRWLTDTNTVLFQIDVPVNKNTVPHGDELAPIQHAAITVCGSPTY